MASYHILIQPWAVYVKETEFFKSQGGNEEKWGEDWKRVDAEGIEHARLIGETMRSSGEMDNVPYFKKSLGTIRRKLY